MTFLCISPFLNLPSEIRLEIFSHVLYSTNPILLLSRKRNQPPNQAFSSTLETLRILSNEPQHSREHEPETNAPHTSLLRVCRQLYTEARPLFFTTNTFTIPLCGWLPWIRPAIIPRQDWNLICHLKLTIYIQPSSKSIRYCGMSGPQWLDNELSALCNDLPSNLTSLRSLVVVVKPVCYLASPGGTVSAAWVEDCLKHCVSPLTRLKQLREVELRLYAGLSEEKQREAWERWKEVNYEGAKADLDVIKVSFKVPED
ncbi:hypothetical protein GJ744_002693 [Endocarpon pusillum]|uniref:DUF7730 domain-containing protein n=1 Tax=Endocarpon pusillum TaxID=364733 RepID=A0A8H7AMK6_9EURO|nr:hypothetical protein GJ744_002693 [Endocarpon pusillum]